MGRMLGMAMIAFVTGASGAWFVSQHLHAPPIAAATMKPGHVLHLEGFTVNLADPEASHFLRLTLDLEVEHPPEGANQEKPAATLPTARIRDSVLSVLTASKADVLLTTGGKAMLKQNLLDVLKTSVPELGVRAIYFTEFLVQR